MLRIIVLFLAAVFTPSLSLGQAAGDWQSPEHIWNASCSYCHNSQVAPDIRGIPFETEFATTVVRNGFPGMPPFHTSEINNEELLALLDWIKQAEKPDPDEQAP